MKLRYNVKGMSCSACVAHIEQSAKKALKTENVSVSLLTNTLTVTVEDGKDEEKIFSELKTSIKNAGYTLERISNKKDKEINKEHKKRVRNLLISAVLTAILMVVSMGHMFGIPMPKLFSQNPYLFGLLQLFITIPVIILNFRFFRNGFSMLFKGKPNMDSLIAIGSGASAIYGMIAIIIMLVGQIQGNDEIVHSYLHNLYFEGAAMILVIVSCGKLLEGRAKIKAAGAINELAKMMPNSASVLRDGRFEKIPIDQIKVGDVIEIKAGETIPVDGKVVEGFGSTDESALTGESIPKEKNVGDSVSTASVFLSGYIKIKAEKIGEDTSLLKMIRLLEDAAASKAPIARIADKVSGIFVPIIIAISVLTGAIWMIATKDINMAFQCAISTLVISCPCSLGLATPLAITVAEGRGASSGILIRSAEALENLRSTKYFLTDKTGTLTEGKPVVTDFICYCEEEKLLKIAYLSESMSSHPLSFAICNFAINRGANKSNLNISADGLEVFQGKGIKAVINENENSNICLIGRPELFEEQGVFIDEKVLNELKSLEEKGRTAVICTLDKIPLGIFGIFDKEREDSKEAISKLKKMGIVPVMLTGDNESSAKAVCDACGIDIYHANLLPSDKEMLIKEYSQKGLCVMVGDGINDSLALASADIGIAIGAGTDVAIDCADVILTKNSLNDAVSAISLSSACVTVIKENLFWGLFYNVICIPVAAGVLYPFFGINLSPMIAAAAMSFSSLCVCLNSLRLKYKKIYINKNEINTLEENDMFGKTKTVTISVEGMMCNNCKAHVEKALLAIKGVKSAEASVENKNVVIIAKESISDDALAGAIIQAGYKVN